jgi:hypothetical protein
VRKATGKRRFQAEKILEFSLRRLFNRNIPLPMEQPKRGRGRPRKYQSPEEAKAAQKAAIRIWKAQHPGYPEVPLPPKTQREKELKRRGRPPIFDKPPARSRHLLSRYGITPDLEQQLLEGQDHKCAICRKPKPAGRALHCDHNHNTGAVRGFLCNKCNLGLHFVENAEFMKQATRYLEQRR